MSWPELAGVGRPRSAAIGYSLPPIIPHISHDNLLSLVAPGTAPPPPYTSHLPDKVLRPLRPQMAVHRIHKQRVRPTTILRPTDSGKRPQTHIIGRA